MNRLVTQLSALAIAALCAASAAARTVSVASVGESAAALAFGDADGKTYRLAVCYGDEDGGATTAGWDTCEVLGTVGAAETSRTVALPAGWGSSVTHLRYFLLSRPYAADLEFIGTDDKNTPAGVYFDTGVKARDGTKMVAEMMVYSDSGVKEFCGAQKGSDVFRLYGVNGKTQRLGYCGSGASINGTSYPIDKTSRFEITTTLTAGSQSISCRKSANNGSSWSSYGSRTDTQSGPVDWDLNLYILAINHDGVAEYEAAMKLYTLTLYSDGDYTTPVRDFIPVQDENGVSCLYDKVTGGFFYNQGANTPTQGTATPKAYSVASSSATVSSSSRSVTVVSAAAGSATLEFGAADGRAYQLAVCYGDEDGGAVTNAWDTYEVLGAVVDAETSRAVALPAGWGKTVTHLRYFLLSRPYAADLEFIGADKNNHFDSEIKARDGSRMVAVIEQYSTTGTQDICGAASGSSVFRLYGLNGTQQRMGYMAYGPTLNGTSYPVAKSTKYQISTTLDDASQNLVCKKWTNGAWAAYGSRSESYAGPIDWDLNLYILAANSDGTVINRAGTKLFSLELYAGGDYENKVRDFIPVLDENGEACLYDKVTGGFFYKQESANLTTGTATPKAYAVASSSATVAAPLPPSVRLAYVESDGTDDYIDLGIVAKDGTKMFAEMEWVSILSDRVFCGARKDNGDTRFFLYSSLNGAQRYGYATGNPTVRNNGTAVSQRTGVRYRVTSQFEAGAQTISIQRQDNGAWVDDAANADTAAGPVDTGFPLYLFARDMAGTADSFCAARVYSLKLWQKDGNGDYQLVRNLVPAKTSDGAAALWDRVSETWFHNAGAGALAAGAESPWSDGFMINVW